MKINRFLIIGSLFCIFLIFCIVFIDLAGVFNYSDLPFVLSMLLYIVFFLIQKASGKTLFVLALYFLIIMGLSYIKTGPSLISERLGEWFYIFFLAGIMQSSVYIFKK